MAPTPVQDLTPTPTTDIAPQADEAGQAVATPEYSSLPARTRSSAPALRRFGQRLKKIITQAFGRQVRETDPLIGGEAVFPADAPNTLAEASLDIDSNRKYYPSPEDWRDEIFYSVFLDRFSRGPGAKPLGDPKSGTSRHGGNLKGLTNKLDYLEALGVTAILLNPVILGLPEAYHGYAPLHLLAVEPYLGTMADFKTFVKGSHKRGLLVVFDILINHMGPIFEYKDGSRWRGMDEPAKEISEWNHEMRPLELAQVEHFTRHGVIENWQDPEQAVNGDFPPNYRHWASNRPQTQDDLIHMAKWWIKETDIDGMRIDAIRHLDPTFRARFIKEVGEYAAQLGKKNFWFLGENSTGVDAEVARDLVEAGIDSAYNYPEYRRVNWALHGKAPTRVLEDSLRQILSAVGSAAGRLLRFIDNHDTYRFLREGEPIALLRVALAFLLFSIGMPLIYYGTEQAFRQTTGRLDPEGPSLPADPENRPDMFPEGQYKFPSSAGDKFDVKTETFQYLRKLSELRRMHPALSRGDQYVRWSDPNGAGLYAFSRIYQEEEVLVVLNTSGEERGAQMWVDATLSPPGVEFTDSLDASFKVSAFAAEAGGSMVSVSVPPMGTRVLVRPAPKK